MSVASVTQFQRTWPGDVCAIQGAAPLLRPPDGAGAAGCGGVSPEHGLIDTTSNFTN